MIPRAIVALLIAPALAGCAVEAPRSGAVASALVGPFEHDVAFVPVARTGDLVRIDYWRPAHAGEARLHVVAVANPYWGEVETIADRAGDFGFVERNLGARGYAFAAIHLPGLSGSTGCWDFLGPREEAGVLAALDWLGRAPWSSGRIVLMGGSYAGFTQVVAMAAREPHVVAAMPFLAITSVYDATFTHGVAHASSRTVALRYQGDYGFVRGGRSGDYRDAWASRLADQPSCFADNEQGMQANDGRYTAWFAARNRTDAAARDPIPVFLVQGFLDKTVYPKAVVPFAAGLDHPTVWLGQFGHMAPSEQATGRSDIEDAMVRFVVRAVEGEGEGVSPGFEVQDSLGRWRHEDAWPPPDARSLTLALADGKLAPAGASGAGASFVDDGRPFGTAREMLDLAGQSDAARLIPKAAPSGAAWIGEPLSSDAWVSGEARVALRVSTTATRGAVVAQLLDCDADACRAFTRGAMSLAQRNGIDKSEPVSPGEVVALSFELFPQDHVVPAGHRIGLSISGTDGDYFLPDPARGRVTIHEDAATPSTITLPLIDPATRAPYLTACGIALKDQPCYHGGGTG